MAVSPFIYSIFTKVLCIIEHNASNFQFNPKKVGCEQWGPQMVSQPLVGARVLHASPLRITPVLDRLTGSRRLPSLAVIETSQKCGQGCALSFSLLLGSWGSVVGERTCLMSALTRVLPLRGSCSKGRGRCKCAKGAWRTALRYVPRQIASYFRGWNSIRHNYCLIVVGLLIHSCCQNDLSFFDQDLWLLCLIFLSSRQKKAFSSANESLKSNKEPVKYAVMKVVRAIMSVLVCQHSWQHNKDTKSILSLWPHSELCMNENLWKKSFVALSGQDSLDSELFNGLFTHK